MIIKVKKQICCYIFCCQTTIFVALRQLLHLPESLYYQHFMSHGTHGTNIALYSIEVKGFTLIELIIVVVILGVIMAVSVPKYMDMKLQAQNAVASGITGTLNSAEHIVFLKSKLDNSDYTCDIVKSNVIVSGVDEWNVSCGEDKATADIAGRIYTFSRDSSQSPAVWTMN